MDYRVSTLPTLFGEKVVLRLHDKGNQQLDMTKLGFGTEALTDFEGGLLLPYGMVLVTGPTGSGKTTTLYSTLKQLATPEVNVCTIEDPIEMIEAAFNQVQVQNNIDMTFAAGVRALMRQDPDIIMVGEIRDLETADMAVQAALTGHLVLSTLHTNDAPTAVTRLLDLGTPAYLLNATVLGVMAQRLVRTLCPHCKQAAPMTPEQEEIWQAMVAPWKAARPQQVYHPVGCLDCRMTGYMGRVGLYEIMLMTPELRKLITPTTDLAKVREQAYREGMKPLRISGAMKVAAGLTTLEEVLQAAPPAQSE
jgi:general secretion pathway protein E